MNIPPSTSSTITEDASTAAVHRLIAAQDYPDEDKELLRLMLFGPPKPEEAAPPVVYQTPKRPAQIGPWCSIHNCERIYRTGRGHGCKQCDAEAQRLSRLRKRLKGKAS